VTLANGHTIVYATNPALWTAACPEQPASATRRGGPTPLDPAAPARQAARPVKASRSSDNPVLDACVTLLYSRLNTARTILVKLL
jgi:hypothetical protein